jgi:hypothetical protein
MLSAAGPPDLDVQAVAHDVAQLRHRVRLLQSRVELVEASLTSRERGRVRGFLRFLLRRR